MWRISNLVNDRHYLYRMHQCMICDDNNPHLPPKKWQVIKTTISAVLKHISPNNFYVKLGYLKHSFKSLGVYKISSFHVQYS